MPCVHAFLDALRIEPREPVPECVRRQPEPDEPIVNIHRDFYRRDEERMAAATPDGLLHLMFQQARYQLAAEAVKTAEAESLEACPEPAFEEEAEEVMSEEIAKDVALVQALVEGEPNPGEGFANA